MTGIFSPTKQTYKFNYMKGVGKNMPDIPSSCTDCYTTCTATCGNDCVGGCSEECVDTCTGTCSESCLFECTGSCKDSCSTGCQETCTSSCELECIASCLGMCQGCTGCSGTCEGTCVNDCINSCQNETTNTGTRVVTESEVLNYIANLKFKRISEFDENPAIFNSDMMATVVDGTLPTYDALDAVSILMESKEKKAFRATAAQLMDFLNRNLRNFIMWKPYSDGTKIRWKRTNDDTEPEPIDLVKLDFPMASETEDGIMSKEDFVKLKEIDISNYYNINEVDTIISELSDIYAPYSHVHEQYLTINTANDTYYSKTVIDELLSNKSDSDHEHDSVYLKLTAAESDYVSKVLLNQTLQDYTNTEELTALLLKKQNVDDALTVDKIPMASDTSDGRMSSTHYTYIESLPAILQNIKNSIPTTTGELTNDANFLTLGDLPKADIDTYGIISISDDSRLTVFDGYLNVKNFGTVNYIRNSTFANSGINWGGDPVYGMTAMKDGNGEYYASMTFTAGSYIEQLMNNIWGSYVTFSMEVIGTGTLTIAIGDIEKDIAFNATDWTRYTVSFPANDTAMSYDLPLTISNNTDLDFQISLRHLMLQNGLFATDWFPHYADGNTIIPSSVALADELTYGICKPDGTTILSNNGIFTAVSNIDDESVDSDDKTWSVYKITNEISSIPNLKLLGTCGTNTIPSIRITDSREASGYGIVINKTPDKFIIGATASDDPFGEITDEVPLRIDLATGICDINGNALTATNARYSDSANFAANDINGNAIHSTYIKISDADQKYMPIDRIGSDTLLGGVKSGGDITINADGTMSVASFDPTLGTSVLPILNGGTGASTAAQALINLGIDATATELNILDGAVITTTELNILHGVSATTTEINLLKGVTSGIQTQLDNKSNIDHTHFYAKSCTVNETAYGVEINSDVTEEADNIERNVWFSNGSDATRMTQTDKFRYNPVTDTLVVGKVLGNASTASKLSTPRNIQLTGDATGSVDFDGSSDITISVNIGNDTHTHDGRYYTKEEIEANYVSRTEYDAAIADINTKLAALI